MIEKIEIRDAVSFLLHSAQDRKVSQGSIVYIKTLEMIDQVKNNDELTDILEKLNRSLSGIEAHGDFTDQEFEKVLLLRKIGRRA